MQSIFHPGWRGFRQLAGGWCGLVVYAGVATFLGPALGVLLGTMDPDHRVQVQGGQHGIQVVLHHPPCCFEHHHGFVASALTVLSRTASPKNPDHVLSFSWEETCAPAALASLIALEQGLPPDRVELGGWTSQRSDFAIFFTLTGRQSSEGQAGLALGLHSTLLRI